MQIITEVDGILTNLRPAYWQAYQEAVHQIGFACADEGTFWRVIRRGDDIGLLVQGGKPRHITAFESKFTEAMASQAFAEKLLLHENAQSFCDRLQKLGSCHFITLSAQAEILSRLLKKLLRSGQPPSVSMITEKKINDQLISIAGSKRPVIVLAAHEKLLRSADEVGFVPIGIASGACIAKRLPRYGAIATYRDVTAFCDARAEGDPVLLRAGIQGDRR